MKKKNRKLNSLIGILLCLVMLIGIVPLQSAVALAEPAVMGGNFVKYEKVTSADKIVEGGKYVITYKDASPTDVSPDSLLYALSTDVNPSDAKIGYPAEITLRSNGDLLVDPDSNYVFTAEKLDESGNPRLQASDGSYIRMNGDGIFHATSNPYITLTYDGEYWSVNNPSARSLTFSNGNFSVTSGSSVTPSSYFEIWTPAPSSSDYIKLASIDQLADFKEDTEFVIVLETEEGLKAIGSGSNWRYDVKPFVDVDGTEYISVDDTYPVVFDFHGAFTSGTVDKVKYCGFDNSGMRLKDSNNYFYPQNASSSYPFRSKSGENNTVHFEYGTGGESKLGEDPGNYSDKIYIRGNGNSTYLGINAEGNYVGNLPRSSEYRIPVQIYVALPDDAVRVEYLDANGNVSKIAYTEADGTITLMSNVADEEYNDYTYAFVGWTMTEPEDTFLSLDDSCNIFDYDNDEDKAKILDSIAEKYGLIGDCNADYSDAVIEMQDKKTQENIDDGTLKLYPVYAVRGFDTVVTALEADNTKIIGISDWKADPDQGLDSYFDGGDSEKWLGYVDVAIYKDGVEWVKPTRLYFRYHNDNTADLTIKFIWDNLLEDDKYQDPSGELDPLYIYMSDKSEFPYYDQSGHYVLDAVYAYQGGSEDGLKYELNWMTDHGGQLDNVEGGSLVQLFVSTKYDVKYYLDDKEITEAAWLDGDYYTTPGTSELFNKVAAKADYKVRSDNDLFGLMDRDFVEDDDPDKEIIYRRDETTGEILLDDKGNPIILDNPHEWFIAEDEDGKRGDPEYYSYLMHEYRHDIPLAKSPEELVPVGKALISKMWSLKNKSLVFQSAHEWSSAYSLKGTQYGTGNTASAYLENVNVSAYSADAPYTFHLYAYTGIPGDIKITNKVTGEGGDKTKEFHYTITLESTDDFDADDVNGWYGDLFFEKGVARFILKDGESVTAEGLPSGVTYTVVEKEFNEDGYASTVAKGTGTIPPGGVIQVDFVNDKPIEKPEEKPVTPPNTGDDNNLAMWSLIMMASLLGMALCMFFSMKKTKRAK